MNDIRHIINNIKLKLKEHQYLGYDPYDLSNSNLKLFVKQSTGIQAKLSFINKISPINIRKLLKIPMCTNSKANALILNSLIIDDYTKNKSEIDKLVTFFLNNKPNDFSDEYFSSGFTFKISLSEYTSGPGVTSLIISLFVIYAFIDLFKYSNDPSIYECIYKFKNLLENKLPNIETVDDIYYSYHFDRFAEVPNATAKIGKFYAKLHSIDPKDVYIIKIKKILNYLYRVQRSDGSWPYSKLLNYSDGFHTAFILDSISEMNKYVNNENYNELFGRSLKNYKLNLFNENRPLHFHRKYNKSQGRSFILETELRDCANAIILLSKIGDNDSAIKVVNWTIDNLYDKENNVAYFFKNKYYTSKIDYIRWQAWLLFALCNFIKNRK